MAKSKQNHLWNILVNPSHQRLCFVDGVHKLHVWALDWMFLTVCFLLLDMNIEQTVISFLYIYFVPYHVPFTDTFLPRMMKNKNFRLLCWLTHHGLTEVTLTYWGIIDFLSTIDSQRSYWSLNEALLISDLSKHCWLTRPYWSIID